MTVIMRSFGTPRRSITSSDLPGRDFKNLDLFFTPPAARACIDLTVRQAAGISSSPPLGAERVGVRWGEPPVSNSRATHLTLPAQPRRAPPSPPERAERGFRPVSAGNLLLQCSSSRTRLEGGIAVFRRRYRCHLCVRIEAYHRCQDGGGWTSPRVVRSGGRVRGPPALPAPSLRAAISLPAKTSVPLLFLLVKLLIANGLWQCAVRF